MQVKNVLAELSAQPEGTFINLVEFNGVNLNACDITGVSPVWEMHPDTDELFYVLEGEFEITLLLEQGPRRHVAGAGDTFCVPKGIWHKPAAPNGCKFLFLTLGESLHSEAEDPRQGNPRSTDANANAGYDCTRQPRRNQSGDSPMPAPGSQPLIAVKDVLKSSHWYAELLGLEMLSATRAGTHGNVYNRLLHGDTIVLQLHAWDDEDHPNLTNADSAPPGHGMLLWFEVDDFDACVSRAEQLQADIVLEPHLNPGPNHRELWLRDPDGYHVVVCSPDGVA